jgi:hypothetical protein
LVLHWDSLGAELHLKVVQLRFEEELVLSAQQADGSSHVLRVQMRALQPEVTALTLSLRGEMSDDEREGSAAGWHTQLRILDRYLSLDPKSRTSFAAFGTAVVPLTAAYDALSHPHRWLCEEEGHWNLEGQRFAITVMSAEQGPGRTLTGEVLSLVEGRELALWCTELGGVIRMRAIPLAGGRARLVGLQVIRWGEEPAALRIREELTAAVDRLIASFGGDSGSA